MRRIYITLLLLLFVGFQNLIAQSGDPKKADDFLLTGNFEQALDEYLLLNEEKPDNLQYQYRIGVCYLNTNFDKSKAIPFLEAVVKDESFDNNAKYLLARAYHFNYQFDKAIEFFNTYKKNGGGTAASNKEVDQQIEYCFNAKEFLKYPVDVTFENLGSNINSKYPDYFPFVPVNEAFLLFNSRRPEASEELANGAYAANVYYAEVQEGNYTKATPLKEEINTEFGDEEVIGLSANGDVMLLLLNNEKAEGDIFITHKKDASFEEPVKLDNYINSKNQEIAASISKDGNTIYFASDRKGGFGGTDIYMSKKLPIGGWGPAQNLGEGVNTSADEDFPNISPDGNTLYFSSKGHTSMGGYDIFTATKDLKTEQFSNVRNLGHPINTTNDDMNFRISETGRYGYIAALRPEGKGDLDIYRVTFNKIETKYTVIKGKIQSKGGKAIEEILIDVSDKSTGDLYGAYLPNFNTMKYVMILPPGEYEIFAEAPGHEPYIEDVKILDKSSFVSEIDKDIILNIE